MILISAVLLAGGWRWTTRIMNSLWVIVMLGLATVFLVLLFKSKTGFINSFNQFSNPITGEADSYHWLIKAAGKEGIDTNPAFSLNNTWPTFAAIASLSIYSWLSIYISGEVRRAKDTTQMKIMSLASFVHIGIAVLLSIVFFWKFGHDFFVAVNALSGSESYPFAAPPYYTFLTSIAGGSSLLAWWLFLTFAVAYPLLILPNITIAVRTVFAWALDGIIALALRPRLAENPRPQLGDRADGGGQHPRPLVGGEQRRRVPQSALRGGAAAAGDDDPARHLGDPPALPPSRRLARLGDHQRVCSGSRSSPSPAASPRSSWPGSSSSTCTTPNSGSTRVTSSATARSSSARRC